METNRKLLVAIDDSPGSWRALDYVSGLAREQKDLEIELFHAADPMPPRLQEFRGAENPQKEKHLEIELKSKQDEWAEHAVQAAIPLTEKARLILEESGISPEKIHNQTVPLLHREDLIDEILKAARENRCDTIVVGRNAFPWVKEVLLSHVGEKLSEKDPGLTVTVID